MKHVLVGALAVCLAASAANAVSVLTQIVTFGGPADLNSAMGVTSNGAGLPFFFFDTRVGTLNSVELSSSYGFNATAFVSSNGTASGVVDVRSAARFSSDKSQVTQVLNNAVNTLSSSGAIGGMTLAPAAYDLVGNGSTYNTLPSIPTPYISSGSGSMNTITLTDASSLQAFSTVGTDSYNVLLSTLTGPELRQSSGRADASSQALINGQLKIVYNITLLDTQIPAGANVPEPATWAMMMMGFGMIGMTLRHRRNAEAVA